MKKQRQVAHDILVFGRGSDSDHHGGRVISEMAQLRVDAVRRYIQASKNNNTDSFRVLFSAGWAANTGMRKPEPEYREANLMLQYAETIGITKMANVTTDVQIESMSTVQDALLAVKSGFFGGRPFSYSQDNPLGIVAQADPVLPNNPRSGHMARCLDATSRTFRIPMDALLPIIADGSDVPESGLTERQARIITKILFSGAYFDFDILLRNKLFMTSTYVIQKSRQLLDEL